MQAVFANKVGTYAGQVAFVGAGKALEQQARDRQTQHCVAEEFEPLVVVRTETAVRQRALERAVLGEAVPDARLQCVEA